MTTTKTVEWIVPIIMRVNIKTAEGEYPDGWQIKHAIKSVLEPKCRVRTAGNFSYCEINVCGRNSIHLSSDFEIGEMEQV
jgi:hypothetical protein